MIVKWYVIRKNRYVSYYTEQNSTTELQKKQEIEKKTKKKQAKYNTSALIQGAYKFGKMKFPEFSRFSIPFE